MPGTKSGGAKTAESIKLRGGADYYAEIGRTGAKASAKFGEKRKDEPVQQEYRVGRRIKAQAGIIFEDEL